MSDFNQIMEESTSQAKVLKFLNSDLNVKFFSVIQHLFMICVKGLTTTTTLLCIFGAFWGIV